MAMERENRAPRGNGRKRRKVCQFCVDKCEHIDYKDAAKLRRFISERSKILPRRTTGTCAMHQRQLTEAHQACPSDRSAALRYRVSWSSKRACQFGRLFSVPKPKALEQRGVICPDGRSGQQYLNFGGDFGRSGCLLALRGGETGGDHMVQKGLQVAIVAVQIVEDAGGGQLAQRYLRHDLRDLLQCAGAAGEGA